MKPFLFSIGGTPIPSFFFFIMVATLACAFYLYLRARANGLRPEVMLDLGMIGMVGGVLGSRIFHILVEAPDYYWEKPMRVFEFWRGGFVSWGAVLALAVALPAYFRLRKLPMLPYLDYCTIGAPIVKFWIRFACLLTGCCYGAPTDVPWAITFTDPAATAYYYYPNIPLHPSQIYSMIHAALLFVLINVYYGKTHEIRDGHSVSRPGHTHGESICVLLMGWTLPRVFLEQFRADSDRGLYFDGMVSTGQITGSLIFVAALIFFIVLRKKAARTQ